MMVVVLILALILLLLVPVIEGIHARSLRTECGYQLGQIGASLELYQLRHDGWFPANQVDGSWRTYLDPYLKSPFVSKDWKGQSPIWSCPVEGEYFANNLVIGDNRYDPTLYVTHWKISQFPRHTRVPVVSDSLPGEYARAAIGDFRGMDFRHSGGAMVLFMDWRVEWIESPGAEVGNWWNEPVRGLPVKPPVQPPPP